MLEFMRNKRVSVAREDPETFSIQAELDDSIYSLVLFLNVRIRDLKCLAVRGEWRRWTTPECPRAIGFLDQAEGFILEPGIEDRIHKTLGRTACRHFANLFIECARAARATRNLVQWEQAKETDPDLTLQAFMAGEGGDSHVPPPVSEEDPGAGPGPVSRVQAVEKQGSVATARSLERGPEKAGAGAAKGSGFMVDLHIHTFPASACASDSAEAMVETAKERGLDALCLTDHNHVWSRRDVDRMMDRFNLRIFRGNEIMTDQGDMLVFGFHQPIDRVIKLSDLAGLVERANGFIIAAHPFRGFLTFGTGQIGLTPQKAMEREMFKHVHGLETLNGKVTQNENRLAAQVAEGLGLPSTGGSDAHDVSSVGTYATRFNDVLASERLLVEALQAGACAPVVFSSDPTL
ncbi:MAG: PHP domain-containing protein [Desulfobacteraceae bacterium]|nr:PHP domain-containing protein [Desulfobacteraceae bacterium]